MSKIRNANPFQFIQEKKGKLRKFSYPKAVFVVFQCAVENRMLAGMKRGEKNLSILIKNSTDSP
jgi:hypothetical protein